MKYYTFSKRDSGIIGKAFEMAIKDALNRRNADSVSPCGVADFRWYHKNYDVKQNGSCVRYSPNGAYIKGSNRIIYATHVSYSVIDETETEITICVNLNKTEMFVVDRSEFIDFLTSINGVKLNKSRGTANIQTCYNYAKKAYHGKKGVTIEEWAAEHEIDDDGILDAILEGFC